MHLSNSRCMIIPQRLISLENDFHVEKPEDVSYQPLLCVADIEKSGAVLLNMDSVWLFNFRAFSPTSAWLFYGCQFQGLHPNHCLALLWLSTSGPSPQPVPGSSMAASSRDFIPTIAWHFYGYQLQYWPFGQI